MPTKADLLADLLDGKLDAAEVPEELVDLASLADAVSEHIPLVPPTDAFRESLREQVVQSATSAGPTGPTGSSGPSGSLGGGVGGTGGATGGAAGAGGATTAATTAGGGLSAIVAAVAAAAVLATSTVAAADRAGPGDLLAGLDRGIETVQLALADGEREVELLVDFAAERVLEAVEVTDPAVVGGLLQRSEELLDQALALAIDQAMDLEQVVAPYAASLRTLVSRTEDPAVGAQVRQILDDLGIDTPAPDVPGDGGAGVPGADDDPTRDDGDGAPVDDGGDDGILDGDDGLLDDPTDELDDTAGDLTDELDDTVDDLTDPLDDTVDDLTDPLDDTVDELDDTTDDTVDDVTDPLDDTVDDVLGG